MNNGINFGHNQKWSAHSDQGYLEEARNEALPLIMRINALAKSRVNRNGHAEFGPGEIAAFFGMKKNQATNLITKAKNAGLFLDGSGQRCIIISSRIVQRNSGTGSCKHHNLNKSGKEIIQPVEEPEETVPDNVDPVTGEVLEDEAEEAPESPVETQTTVETSEDVEEAQETVESVLEAVEAMADETGGVDEEALAVMKQSPVFEKVLARYMDESYHSGLDSVARAKWAVSDIHWACGIDEEEEVWV